MAKHLRITGLVQGVGYRASLESRARALHLSGWVRNRLDGSVEAVVSGDPAAVEQLIAWAHRGPPAARVNNVVVEDDTDDGLASASFVLLPTC